MKAIFKTVVEPLISLPKCCFWIQPTLICVYHIILKEDGEKVLKSPSFYPPNLSPQVTWLGQHRLEATTDMAIWPSLLINATHNIID